MSTQMRNSTVSKLSSVLWDSGLAAGRAPRSACEDPLVYLPRKRVQEYAKDQTIYSPDKPCDLRPATAFT